MISREDLALLTVRELREYAKPIGKAKGRGVSKLRKSELIDLIYENLNLLPPDMLRKLRATVEEKRGARPLPKGERGVTLEDVLREIRELRRLVEEALGGVRRVSLREFSGVLLEEYWRLSGSRPSYVPLEDLRKAVCSRLGISSDLFDSYFADLKWVSDKVSVSESRRTVHVLIRAKTPGELVWK